MKVTDHGDPVKPACPKCGGQCVYNGNYFCIECDWALPDIFHPKYKTTQAELDWFERAYVSLLEYRKKRNERRASNRNKKL